MTEVVLVGERTVRSDLFAFENARRALSAYDLREPYRNALALDTVSLGAAVSLLNDLGWYLARATEDAFVREPSVDSEEYLSRGVAEAIRDERQSPDELGEWLKVYESEDNELRNPDIYPREAAPEGELQIRLQDKG
jgi:hypothetical protein